MSIHIQDTPAIAIRDLNKVYKSRSRGEVKAVNDLSLTVEPGQVFGFLGANGAGKTTTIKMMCGLVQPTAGQIKLNGYDVAKERSQAMRQIGAVLEGTRNVYWRLSAWENLLYFGRLKGIYGRELHQRARMLLDELELLDRRDDKIRTFSRGMQQKVAIACALIADPSIVLLDEPTLGLDVKAALTVKNWIAKLAQESRKTIILTTHQLDMAQQLCDRVAIINKGELLTNQPTSEMLELSRTEFYEIKVRGELNGHTSAIQQQQMNITQDGGITVISGAMHDEAELYRLIDTLRSWDLPLVSVNPVEPNLEQIFMNYLDTHNTQEVAS